MILSSITVCLVPEASGGPFVYHGDVPTACRDASAQGFDAIEIFAPSGRHVNRAHLQELLGRHRLQLAAVGTGAGMLLHNHSLSDPNTGNRQRACAYVREIIDFGADFGAPAIVGSMQGQTHGERSRESALEDLADSIRELAGHAAGRGTELLMEPLNRYETDLVKTLSDGVQLIEVVGAENVKLLADLFHMNIEETDPTQAILDCPGKIGHVHFVDSNRRAAGFGHMDYGPIAHALSATGYNGFASAEAFPLPDAKAAAEMTIKAYRRYLAG